MLGLSGSKMPEFNFKWTDNTQNDGDIMDFYLNGDVAPGGRFKFAFVKSEENKKTGIVITAIVLAVTATIGAITGIFIKKKKRSKS